MRRDSRAGRLGVSREEKKYIKSKRLKTIIYRWHSPLGNHMLYVAFMRFILCERVRLLWLWLMFFFLSRFTQSWSPLFALSFTLPCKCWVWVFRFEPTVQYAVVSSELRELFPFYQYVDCMKCEYIHFLFTAREYSSDSVFWCFILNSDPNWYLARQNIFRTSY